MKKLLSIFGSLGLVASNGIVTISCNHNGNEKILTTEQTKDKIQNLDLILKGNNSTDWMTPEDFSKGINNWTNGQKTLLASVLKKAVDNISHDTNMSASIGAHVSDQKYQIIYRAPDQNSAVGEVTINLLYINNNDELHWKKENFVNQEDFSINKLKVNSSKLLNTVLFSNYLDANSIQIYDTLDDNYNSDIKSSNFVARVIRLTQQNIDFTLKTYFLRSVDTVPNSIDVPSDIFNSDYDSILNALGDALIKPLNIQKDFIRTFENNFVFSKDKKTLTLQNTNMVEIFNQKKILSVNVTN